MKKLSNIMLGLTAAMAFTACSSTDEVNVPGATQDVTVTVVTDDALVSRAGVATVEGYELKCVMQLVGDNGATVGTQAVSDAAAGSATFTIKAADIDAGATKALFWAEYVPTAGAKKVYNSSDLTAISYAVTEFDATDAALMAAADAFAGSITTLENGASATLTRPLIKFNFTPTNPEAAASANKLTVKYSATSGYNVLTRNCVTAASQDVTYTNAAFNPAAEGAWFSSFIFAPANLEKFDQPIVMTLEGAGTQTLTIPANTLPMDANFIVNTTAEISDTPGNQDLDVNVSINGSFENEPKPATFEVGSYVNAAGEPVSTAAEAVGVVFKVGAIDGDDASLYPAEFAGKTIKGYVVALENTIKGRQVLNSATIAALPVADDIINGTQNMATFENNSVISTSNCFVIFNEWVAAHALTGSNHTAWYIPAQPQMQAWFSMLMPTTPLKGDAFGPTGTEAFRALFPEDTLFDRTPIQNCMYVTTSVNSNGNVMGTSLAAATLSVSFSQIDVQTKTQSVLCRPMFTVFE